MPVGQITYHPFFLQDGERTLLGLDLVFLQFFPDNRVVIPINEGIRFFLVLQDAHFGIHIILHAMVVTVQMVGRDVEQYGNAGPETVHVVQLETAQFYHIVVIIFLGYLQGQALADIPGQPDIVTRFLEDMVNQGCRGSLAVAARNANHLGMRITSRKLDFRNDRDTGLFHFQHHRGIFRYARAFYHLVRIQD